MRAFGTSALALTGDPAFDLLSSLLIAAVGVAIVVVIVVKLARESEDDPDDRTVRPVDETPEPDATHGESADDAEHTSDDVV